MGAAMHMTAEAPVSELPVPAKGRQPGVRANFLPYPASTLGPAIVPNDLTSFRSRGASEVEKRLHQELLELREKYLRVIDQFNWNRLVYEAEFRFEPVTGETYHLYRDGGRFSLSLVGPQEWAREFVGSFRLNIDRCWEPVAIAPGFDREAVFGPAAQA
jgi:hypothetical protein